MSHHLQSGRSAAPRTKINTRPARAAPPTAAKAINMIVARLAQKTRYVDPGLITRWPALAGPRAAAFCRPGRMLGAGEGRTLEVHTPNGAAAARLQFEHDAIVDRLNAYFGSRTVGRLLIRQDDEAETEPGDPDAGRSGGLARFRTAD
ncbi:MAG: DUF721 domain-containing protein [Pseudomonadota bacterium]